ncbi:MAG: hypothetical protein IIA00_04830, partial [Proteobacteria bacterium]|nr:hypothetical protein [Pseudomonadota bacterium]
MGNIFKDEPKAPKPPDPFKLIEAQTKANRITEFTPIGTREFGEIGPGGEFIPSTGGAAARTTLPETLQQALDLQQQAGLGLAERGLEQIEQLPTGPISFEGLPEFGSELDFTDLVKLPGTDDFSVDASRVEDATFQRLTGLLNPGFERQDRTLFQRLANQGLPEGGEAFDDALEQLRLAQGELRGRAALDAVGAGRAEQSRLFGLADRARGVQLAE